MSAYERIIELRISTREKEAEIMKKKKKKEGRL